MPIRRSRLQDIAAAKRKQRYKLYSTPAWKACRAIVLARDGHVCAMCGGYGHVVDHYRIPLRRILAEGGDPCDPRDCRVLCRVCHGKADGAGM